MSVVRPGRRNSPQPSVPDKALLLSGKYVFGLMDTGSNLITCISLSALAATSSEPHLLPTLSYSADLIRFLNPNLLIYSFPDMYFNKLSPSFWDSGVKNKDVYGISGEGTGSAWRTSQKT